MSEHPGKKVLAEILADYVGDDKFLKVASYVLDLESRLEKAEAAGAWLRNDALDEAAEVCDRFRLGPNKRVDLATFEGVTAFNLAAAIRALKSPTPDQGDEA